MRSLLQMPVLLHVKPITDYTEHMQSIDGADGAVAGSEVTFTTGNLVKENIGHLVC